MKIKYGWKFVMIVYKLTNRVSFGLNYGFVRSSHNLMYFTPPKNGSYSIVLLLTTVIEYCTYVGTIYSIKQNMVVLPKV